MIARPKETDADGKPLSEPDVYEFEGKSGFAQIMLTISVKALNLHANAETLERPVAKDRDPLL